MKLIKAQIRLIENEEVFTITSLQIAEQTGKRHDHVMRDIKAMLEGIEISLPKFGGSYINSRNQEQPMLILPEREAMILASGYDVKLRALFVDAFLSPETKPFKSSNPILDAVVAQQIAFDREVEESRRITKALEIRQSEFEQATNDGLLELAESIKPENRELSEIPPKKGFRAIKTLFKKSRLSRSMVEKLIKGYGISECACMRFVDEANGYRKYKAYKESEYKLYENRFIAESTKVNKTQYEHPELEGRFTIKALKH